MPVSLCEFAEDLRSFLSTPTPEGMLKEWDRLSVDLRGKQALRYARRGAGGEPVLTEVDGLLLRAMSRITGFSDIPTRASARLRTFRYAELERMQCAASAVLVDRRFGAAGLHSLVDDREAPLARRYFAFLCLSERHLPGDWEFFCKYLVGRHHHALVATAIESLRYYPEHKPSELLVRMFGAVRRDSNLRRFLGPRILQTLYVLADDCSRPLFEDLLSVGHTEADPVVCEVMRAIVMIFRLTGSIPQNSKFSTEVDTKGAMDFATLTYENLRSSFISVEVL